MAGLSGACASPKPPPVVAVEPAPPPPPPKKCNTLEDACVAGADTRLPIQASGWSLALPATWTYADDPVALVARTEGGSLGVAVHETGDKKNPTGKRGETLDRVTQKLGLAAPKKKIVWPPKPAKVLTVGTVKIELFQFTGFTKDQKPGALLVFASKLSDTQSLLGVGFVLESDTHDADKAILACVDSLRADSPADGREGRDGGAPK
jgi:hypothetical protein